MVARRSRPASSSSKGASTHPPAAKGKLGQPKGKWTAKRKPNEDGSAEDEEVDATQVAADDFADICCIFKQQIFNQ